LTGSAVVVVASTRAAAGSAETWSAEAGPAPAGVASPRHQLSIELDQPEEGAAGLATLAGTMRVGPLLCVVPGLVP
jgi:hypothetical protein